VADAASQFVGSFLGCALVYLLYLDAITDLDGGLRSVSSGLTTL
jgi:glycerol uptake facilitator-like aquaporin